jgi:DNA-directed RNA polymerase subunit K/omega
MPPKKTKTLYSNSGHIDISSLLSKTVINDNQQTGGKKATQVKKYSKHKQEKDDEFNTETEDEPETEVEDIQYGSGEEQEEEDENEDLDADEPDEPDEPQAEEKKEDETEEEKEDDEIEDVEQNAEELDDSATVDTSKHCYSKYAKDGDEIDLDEYFKDNDITITKTGRVGKPFLFKYEMVRLLADRSRQLAEGAKPMIKNTSGLSHKEIAVLELKNKMIPLIIERPIPNSGKERWRLSELEIPNYD